LLSSRAPTGPEWAYEVKWDGYRLAVHIGPGAKVRIITRGGHDWTKRFPTIAHDARELGVDSAIIDGEAVVLDERGAADFVALRKALGVRGGKRSAAGAILYAFDLLYLNGQDLNSLPLGQRREMLGDVLVRARQSSLRCSEEVDAGGGGAPSSTWPASSGSGVSSRRTATRSLTGSRWRLAQDQTRPERNLRQRRF